MKRSSLVRTCLAGALVAGLGLATLVAPANAVPAGKSPTRGTGVYVKGNYAVVPLGSPPRTTPVVRMGPFSAGSYVVSFSTRVLTTFLAANSADVQCSIVADRGLVSIGLPMSRVPRSSIIQMAGFGAFTTSAAASIAVRCQASDSGTPIPGQVTVDSSQMIVQRVSTVHNG